MTHKEGLAREGYTNFSYWYCKVTQYENILRSGETRLISLGLMLSKVKE
jgi:hypothetical protein